jgi:hypothetical protein
VNDELLASPERGKSAAASRRVGVNVARLKVTPPWIAFGYPCLPFQGVKIWSRSPSLPFQSALFGICLYFLVSACLIFFGFWRNRICRRAALCQPVPTRSVAIPVAILLSYSRGNLGQAFRRGGCDVLISKLRAVLGVAIVIPHHLRICRNSCDSRLILWCARLCGSGGCPRRVMQRFAGARVKLQNGLTETGKPLNPPRTRTV